MAASTERCIVVAASTERGIVVATERGIVVAGWVVPPSIAAVVYSGVPSMVVASTVQCSREQLLVAGGPWF